MSKQVSDQTPHPVEVLADRLHDLLRVGVRPAKLIGYLDILDLLWEGPGNENSDAYERAVHLAAFLESALDSLGDGPVGLAAQTLFGTTTNGRGRLLKDRRRIAAAELDLLPSTFRKYYEDDIIMDVAVALWHRSQTL